MDNQPKPTIDTLLESRNELESKGSIKSSVVRKTKTTTTEACTELDPLETTIDLLYQDLTLPPPPPSLPDDPLEHTTDLLYKGTQPPTETDEQKRKRIKQHVKQLHSLRLSKLHDTYLTSVIEKLDTTATTTTTTTPSLPTRRFHVACQHPKDLEPLKQQLLRLTPDQRAQTNSLSITKSALIANQDQRIPLQHFLSTLVDRPFASLHTLVLRGLLLTDLPSSLATIAPTCRTLVASHNSFRTFPHVLSKMMHLTNLDLSHNRLECPPEFSCGLLTQLITFNLSHNKLMTIPSEITQFLGKRALRELFMDRNCLPSIPKSIVQLKHCNVLTLFGNPFVNPYDKKWSKETFAALRGEFMNKNNEAQRKRHKNNTTMHGQKSSGPRSTPTTRKEHTKRRNRPKFFVGNEQEEAEEDFHGLLNASRIKRGKLTGTWDMRPKQTGNNSNSVDVAVAELYPHVHGIREIVACVSQLPYIVAYGGELSPLWKLIFQMKDLTAIFLFNDSDAEGNVVPVSMDDSAYAKDLSLIARQISLAFQVVNQCKIEKRGKECWKIVVAYHYTSSVDTVNE